MQPMQSTLRRSRAARMWVWRLTRDSYLECWAWDWWKVRTDTCTEWKEILYVLAGADFQTYCFRLQLHGLRDVQAKLAGWVGGRPEARVWGQEGQVECAAAPHPEIQGCFHRVGPQGKEVGDFVFDVGQTAGWLLSDRDDGPCLLFSQVRWSIVTISRHSSGVYRRTTAGHGDPTAH